MLNSAIEQTYKEEEYTRNSIPYVAYFQAISEVFDLTIIDNFADLGCNNGSLIKTIKEHYPHVEVMGYDYFEWSRNHAHPLIKENIHIADLSLPLKTQEKYSIVNCAEVGEHIPKEHEQIFLNNITSLSSDIILLTWSNVLDEGGQHLNPRPKKYIIQELEKRGFSFWNEQTKSLSSYLANKLDGIGHQWWGDNIMVFKKRSFASIHSDYFIQGIATNNETHKKHFKNSGLVHPSLQAQFLNLISIIKRTTSEKKAFSILRASDGDYFFLRKIARGSAQPGKRATTVSYDKLPIALYRKLFWQNDCIAISLEKHEKLSWKKFIFIDFFEKVVAKAIKKEVPGIRNRKIAYGIDILLAPVAHLNIFLKVIIFLFSLFKRNIYKEKAISIVEEKNIPLETVYALITTKWIFRNYPSEIGIIASSNKIKVIEELMKNEEYRNYLGVPSFVCYIGVPEKGAANDVESLSKDIGEKIKNSSAKIFLVGVGSAKIGLLPLLKYYKKAIFIDVGAGIDALAGIVSQDRPYFANWTNFKLQNYDYSKIDFMDQGNPARDDIKYKTVVI